MTNITESKYTIDDHEQAGGGRYVVERHIDNLGRTLTFGPWLCVSGMDPAAVMELRATRLNADFALKDAEELEAANGRIPWSKLEFRDQLGAATEKAMDKFFKTFESNPGLTEDQKDNIRTGWERYKEAHYIQRPLRPEVLGLLGLFKLLGIITQEKIDAIVAAAGA